MHHILDRYAFVNKHFVSPSKTSSTESATELGTAVHNEIKDYIRSPTTRSSYHYQTLYFFQSLKKLGWEAVSADVPIADPNLGYRTKVDVIARNPVTDTTIVIEVKTTSATVSEAATQIEAFKVDKLLSPTWGKVLHTDTPVHRALAQVTLEYHAMKKNYARINAFVFYLFRNPTFTEPANMNTTLPNPNEYLNHVRIYHPIDELLSDDFYQSLL